MRIEAATVANRFVGARTFQTHFPQNCRSSLSIKYWLQKIFQKIL